LYIIDKIKSRVTHWSAPTGVTSAVGVDPCVCPKIDPCVNPRRWRENSDLQASRVRSYVTPKIMQKGCENKKPSI